MGSARLLARFLVCALAAWFLFAAVATAQGLPSGPRTPQVHEPPLQVLVPAYFYPVTGSPWTRLDAAATAYPGRVVAIGNPFNGPGLSFDAVYDATFRSFRASGGKLIGYVYTSYGARPLAQVQADMDTWVSWYELDGFFLDEMDNAPGAYESYYQDLTEYGRSLLPSAYVVGNPGTSTSPGYLVYNGAQVVSQLCIFESGTGFLGWAPDPWVLQRSRQHFCALAYGIAAAGWQASVDHAWASNCGSVFVTNDGLPNPWDTLPPYFESMLAYIDANY